jgi:DNA-binding transcriptional ArsR family regulator
VRAEVVEAIRLLGPCSVAEIAAAIDRPADAIYKHLEPLEKAGFVVEAGFRKTGRNAERLVDVVAEDFVVDFRGRSVAAQNKAIVAMTNSFLKAAGRAVRDSADAGQIELAPEGRTIVVNYELGRLTPERFEEVRGLVRRLKAIMDEGKRSPEGRLYMTLAVATPVTRRRGATRTEGSEQPKRGRSTTRTTSSSTSKRTRRA